MRQTFGMNPHQKAVYKPRGKGERRAGREQIAELLEKSRSENAHEWCEAAENLCPCHVRKRIEPVWAAIYRMLEDPDVRVRRAAWHTLEDGGTPEDPTLDAIIARVRESETDKQVLSLLRQVAGGREEREMHTIKALGQAKPKLRGKCDFCGGSNVLVEQDLGVMIPTGPVMQRAAMICADCVKNG